MKTIFNNLQVGNTVTQRNAFLFIVLVLIVVTGFLNHYGVINLSGIKNK